jgi:hypothetical protein
MEHAMTQVLMRSTALAALLPSALPLPTAALGAQASGSGEMEAVRQAQREVDAAWEAFHSAAVGGTLASPETQVTIEQALHDARRLLIQARRVAGHGEPERLEPLLLTIRRLSTQATAASREPKP